MLKALAALAVGLTISVSAKADIYNPVTVYDSFEFRHWTVVCSGLASSATQCDATRKVQKRCVTLSLDGQSARLKVETSCKSSRAVEFLQEMPLTRPDWESEIHDSIQRVVGAGSSANVAIPDETETLIVIIRKITNG